LTGPSATLIVLPFNKEQSVDEQIEKSKAEFGKRLEDRGELIATVMQKLSTLIAPDASGCIVVVMSPSGTVVELGGNVNAVEVWGASHLVKKLGDQMTDGCITQKIAGAPMTDLKPAPSAPAQV
jgi:hypothetical protein